MKRVLFLLAAGSLVLSAGGNIKDTKHNLSASGTLYTNGAASAETQICKFCHTPHGAALKAGTGAAMRMAPLWGHDTTVATGFGTPSNTNGAGSTFACLSCHDGTVAINANTQVVASDGDIAPLGAMNAADSFSGNYMATNMRKTVAEANHPVNVNYTTYEALGYLVDHTTWNGTYKPRLFKADTGTDLYVQCSSCHSVHGSTVAALQATPLLRVPIDGSLLCLTCHNK